VSDLVSMSSCSTCYGLPARYPVSDEQPAVMPPAREMLWLQSLYGRTP
jgi:hypothetical protein